VYLSKPRPKHAGTRLHGAVSVHDSTDDQQCTQCHERGIGRRLIAHHYPEVFTANEKDRLPGLAKLAVEAMARQESNCARNGILLMSDMLRYVRGVTGTTGVSIKEQIDSAFHNGVVYPLDLPHGDD